MDSDTSKDPLKSAKRKMTLDGLAVALREPKIQNVLWKFFEFQFLLSIRLVSKSWNEMVSASTKFLEAGRFVIGCPAVVEIYEGSQVKWSQVVLAYWPTSTPGWFWELKAEHVTELVVRLHPAIRLRGYDFYQIMLPLTNLTTLVIASTLAHFKMFDDFGLVEKLSLGQSMSNLKSLQINYLLDEHRCVEDACFQIHLNNCIQLLRIIPVHQLQTLTAVTGEGSRKRSARQIGMIAGFVGEGLFGHAHSLKNVACDTVILPCTLGLLGNLESLELTSLNLNVWSTMKFFEKAQLVDGPHSDEDYEQVKAWRTFAQFMSRQQNLTKLELQIGTVTKKIMRQLFPATVTATLKYLNLAIEHVETEETLKYLRKLTHLKTLTLDVNNFSEICTTNPKSNFLAQLSSSLENLCLVSISYPPMILLDLIQRLSLKSLRIYGGSTMVTDEVIQTLIKTSPDLKILTMTPAFQVTDNGLIGKHNLRELSRKCSSSFLRWSNSFAGVTRSFFEAGLISLTIRDAKITNSTLRRGLWLLNLIELDISGCSKVSYRGLQELWHQTPRLKTLHISGTNVVQNDLKKMLAKFPTLFLYKEPAPGEVTINRDLPRRDQQMTDDSNFTPGPSPSPVAETIIKDSEEEQSVMDPRLQMLDILQRLTASLAMPSDYES